MFLRKNLLAVSLAGYMAVLNSLPVMAISNADNPVPSANITIAGLNTNAPTITINDIAGKLGKIQWDDFDIPLGQIVSFAFTANNQTILNYVPIAYTVAAASDILGDGTAAMIIGSTGIGGRVMLINPNGITFSGSKINTGAAALNSTFFASTLDLATPFADINADTTDINFETVVDANGFANGIFSETATAFNDLKGVTLLANGIALASGTNITLESTYDGYDSFLQAYTAGEVSVTDLDLDQPPDITINSPNTVAPCTNNQAGGVRYYQFNNDGTLRDIKASQFQIAMCSNTYRVGIRDDVNFNGDITIINESNLDFNNTGYVSPVKITPQLFAEGASGAGPQVYISSSNPGQESDLVLICNANQTNANIFINGVQGKTVPGDGTWSPNTAKLDPDDPLTVNNINVITLASLDNTFDTSQSTTLNCAGGVNQCLGDCADPPGPKPPNGNGGNGGDGGDGGGGGAAVAIPIAIGGGLLAGLFGVVPLIAKAPEQVIQYYSRAYRIQPCYYCCPCYSCSPSYPYYSYDPCTGITGAASNYLNYSNYYNQYYNQNYIPGNGSKYYYYSQLQPYGRAVTGGAVPLTNEQIQQQLKGR